jgi:thioredoxin-like negative regulator of GroEL
MRLLGSALLFICGSGLPRGFGVPCQDEYTISSIMTQPQKKTRRQMLEEFVAAKPDDSFARYGLAMECANSGDTAAADEQFKALMGSHPDYVAAYFQYGQFLARIGRTDEARSTLASGIATARRTGDDHARSEMEAALAELG